MKRYLMLSLLAVAGLSFASPPEGLSFWAYSYCHTPEIQEREQCSPFSADMTVLYRDGQICGEIAESWFFKSPRAGFFSSDFRNGGVVKFADSFQEDKEAYGSASLKFSEAGAAWKVLQSPPGGLVGNVSELMREERSGDFPASCDEVVKLWSLPVGQPR